MERQWSGSWFLFDLNKEIQFLELHMQLFICFKTIGMPLWNDNNISILVSGGNPIITPNTQDESYQLDLGLIIC